MKKLGSTPLECARGPIARSLAKGLAAAMPAGLLSVLVAGAFTSIGRGPVAA